MATEEPKKMNKTKDSDAQQKLIEGSTWMTVGSFVSRLLGALYIIPWMAWMGDTATANGANALFQVGYLPYGFFLNLATAGIPSAISQQVSHYNAIEEYEISKSIYKRALQIMAFSGIVSGIVMYVFAPQFSAASPNASLQDGIVVIRSLVPALFIIPMMSVTRGFIQGHNTMVPSAMSQIIEQFTRVIFMLASVYLVRQLLDGTVLTAVSLSTFAAFVGAVFSLIYLVRKLRNNDDSALSREVWESRGQVHISTNDLMISIIKTAIPFILISTGITLSQFIDQFTYAPIMEQASNLSALEIQTTYGVSHANANKLIMILISFGTSISTTSVPLLSQMIAEKNFSGLKTQFAHTIQLLFLIMFPASLGMALLAEPLYAIFYNASDFGTTVTQVSAIVAFLWALFVVLANILKATNVVKPMIMSLFLGLALKLLIQQPFVANFGVYGMLITTIIAFTFICAMMFIQIYKKIGFDVSYIARRTSLIGILTLIMGIAVWFTRSVLTLFLNPESTFHALIILGIGAAIGVAVYGYLILKTRLVDKLLGPNFGRYREKLGIK